MPPDDPRYKEIPPRYHSAFPLDENKISNSNSNNSPSNPNGLGGNSYSINKNNASVINAASANKSFGYPSVIYRVTDQIDGHQYALRRYAVLIKSYLFFPLRFC
jgi:hypothetical protein